MTYHKFSTAPTLKNKSLAKSKKWTIGLRVNSHFTFEENVSSKDIVSAPKNLEFHRLSLFQAALTFFLPGATSCSSVIWLKMTSLDRCPLLVQHNYLNILLQYSGREDFEDICFVFSKKQKGNTYYYYNMSKYILGYFYKWINKVVPVGFSYPGNSIYK